MPNSNLSCDFVKIITPTCRINKAKLQKSPLKAYNNTREVEMNKYKLIIFLLAAGIIYALYKAKKTYDAIPITKGKKESTHKTKPQRFENFYSIVIDRFADGDESNNHKQTDLYNPNSFHGGDLAGVTKKLKYIKKLGITAIILSNPFQQNKRPIEKEDIEIGEKYKIYPFTGSRPTAISVIDEIYGDNDDLLSLTQRAHELGLKVYIKINPTFVDPASSYRKSGKKIISPSSARCNYSDPSSLTSCVPKGLLRFSQLSEDFLTFYKTQMMIFVEETEIDGFYIERPAFMKQEMISYLDNLTLELSDQNPDFNIFYGKKTTVHSHFRGRFNNKNFGYHVKNQASNLTKEFLDLSINQSQFLKFYLILSRFAHSKQRVEQLTPNKSFSLFNAYDADESKSLIHWTFMLFNNVNIVVNYGEENYLEKTSFPDNFPNMKWSSYPNYTSIIKRMLQFRSRNQSFLTAPIEILYEEADFIVLQKVKSQKVIAILAINLTSEQKDLTLPMKHTLRSKKGKNIINGKTQTISENGLPISLAPMGIDFITF